MMDDDGGKCKLPHDTNMFRLAKKDANCTARSVCDDVLQFNTKTTEYRTTWLQIGEMMHFPA